MARNECEKGRIEERRDKEIEKERKTNRKSQNDRMGKSSKASQEK